MLPLINSSILKDENENNILKSSQTGIFKNVRILRNRIVETSVPAKFRKRIFASETKTLLSGPPLKAEAQGVYFIHVASGIISRITCFTLFALAFFHSEESNVLCLSDNWTLVLNCWEKNNRWIWNWTCLGTRIQFVPAKFKKRIFEMKTLLSGPSQRF